MREHPIIVEIRSYKVIRRQMFYDRMVVRFVETVLAVVAIIALNHFLELHLFDSVMRYFK